MTKKDITGHAAKVSANLTEQAEKDWFDALQNKPLPKLLMYRSPACRIYYESPYDDHYPVPTRTLNISEMAGYSIEDLKSAEMNPALEEATDKHQWDLLETIQGDLRKLGVTLQKSTHRVAIDGICVDQLLLELPLMKMVRTPERIEPERDIDGAAILLAYLLDKKLVTEQEIIQADEKIHYNIDPPYKWPAFGKLILTLAKSPEIQAKIRTLHDQGAGAVMVK